MQMNLFVTMTGVEDVFSYLVDKTTVGLYRVSVLFSSLDLLCKYLKYN